MDGLARSPDKFTRPHNADTGETILHLLAKEGKEYLPAVKEIAALVPGPVSGEVLATVPRAAAADVDAAVSAAREGFETWAALGCAACV